MSSSGSSASTASECLQRAAEGSESYINWSSCSRDAAATSDSTRSQSKRHLGGSGNGTTCQSEASSERHVNRNVHPALKRSAMQETVRSQRSDRSRSLRSSRRWNHTRHPSQTSQTALFLLLFQLILSCCLVAAVDICDENCRRCRLFDHEAGSYIRTSTCHTSLTRA